MTVKKFNGQKAHIIYQFFISLTSRGYISPSNFINFFPPFSPSKGEVRSFLERRVPFRETPCIRRFLFFFHTDAATIHSSFTALIPLIHECYKIIDFHVGMMISKVAAENMIRKPYLNWAVKRVTRSLQVLWPRSRTNIFGSNATGLSLPTSDVDLVVCLPPVRNLVRTLFNFHHLHL